jgi:AhpD family alkylhydroperoxidase
MPATQHLVEIRASQINGCAYCTDMHTKDAAPAGETPVRLNLVATWREATVFTADRRHQRLEPPQRHHPPARRRLPARPVGVSQCTTN